MPLRFLLDENLRGDLWGALKDHNARGQYPVDTMRVGDSPAPPLGSSDADLLLWAEQEGRILVTLDKNTMPGHLRKHLQGGRHSPGVFLVRLSSTVGEVVFYLAAAAYASDPVDWLDRFVYIP